MNPLSRKFYRATALVTMMFLLIMTFPFPSEGLDEVNGNLIFNGGGSFSGSSYVRSGDGSATDPYVISDYAMGTYRIQISNSAEHVMIRNITFAQSTSWAISLSSTSNVDIINVTTIGRNQVMYASSCQDLFIFECNFSKIQSATNSFQFLNVADISIRDSIFSKDPVTGAGRIHFNNQGSGHMFDGNECDGVAYTDERIHSDGLISNNTFIDSPVSITGGNTGARILDNTMSTSTGNALSIFTSYRLVISRNFFKGRNGIYFQSLTWQTSTDPGYINNNTFESCGVGINTENTWQTRTSRYNILKNYFGNCTGKAIDLNNANNNNIWQNIFYHNAGTDNISAGSQAEQNGWGGPTWENKWTIGSIGNFWANHRSPDADNNGITDVNYTIPLNGLDTRPSTNPYFDTTPPTVVITEPAGGTFPWSYVRVRWNAFDDLSGLDRLELSVDNGPTEDILHKSHHSLFLEKGFHEIKIVAYDKAGLYGESMVTVNIPKTEDVLTLDHPRNNAFYSATTHQLAWSVKAYFEPISLKLTIDGNESNLLPIARFLTKEFEEGPHTVKVEIVDDDGMAFEKTANFVIDRTPPEVQVNSPLYGSVISSSIVTFNYTAEDNIGIDKVEIQFDNGSYKDVTGRQEFSEFLSEGERIFNIRAFDLAGIETNLSIPFTIGGVSGIQILEPINGSVTKNTTLQFRWEYDGNFQWKNSYLRVGKGVFEDIGGAKTKDITLRIDGEYIITIRLEDIYGNYIEESTMVIKDTRSPIGDFIFPKNGYVISQRNIQVTWKGTDNLQIPLSGYQLKIDDGSWEDVGNITSKEIYLDPGAHILGLKIIDKAGNIGEKEISFYIDVKPPEVILLSPTDGEYLKDSSTEFRWEASDDHDLSNLTLVIDHRSRIEVLGRSSYVTTIGVDGEHEISLLAMDSAGNIVNITVKVFVDLIPPSLKWVREPIGYQDRDWINISWNATDEVGIDNLSLMVNEIQIFLPHDSDHLNLTLEEGSYRFSLIAIDRVGWDWEIFTTEDLVIDLTPPGLEVDLERSTVNGRRATIYWTSSDGGSGIESTFIDIDGEGFNPVISGNLYTFEEILSGEHRVTLRVTDSSGNSKEVYWDFQVEEGDGSQGGDDDGGTIPTFGLIAIILVALLIVFMIVVVIISKKRSKAEEKKFLRKPQKIDIALPSSRTPVGLTHRPLNLDLPPVASHKVETTEEGSGYIRPKTEDKKMEKKILDLKEDSTPEKDIPKTPDEGIDDRTIPSPRVATSPPVMDQEITVDLPEEGPPIIDEEEIDEDVFDPLKFKKSSKEMPVWDEDQQEEPDVTDWDEEDFDDIEEIEEVDEWDE